MTVGPAARPAGSTRSGGVPGYRFQVDGHLDPHWSAWFGGLTLAQGSDGTSTLSGLVADQAQLHGILAKIRDLGITLIAVHRFDLSDDDDLRRGHTR
jgi:hypothetical protein